MKTKPIIPKAQFQFGQRVLCNHGEGNSPPFEAIITGVSFDHRRDREVFYTLTEDNGGQSDGWGEDRLTPLS
jgi:hypothetical protein